MIFGGKAKAEFDVKDMTSKEMEAFISKCMDIYKGEPDWKKGNIRTVNFAKAICSETARLTIQGTKITADGEGTRAEWVQEQIDNIYYSIRNWIEYAGACGTVVLKFNGESVDLVTPDKFMITNHKNGNVRGIVFSNSAVSEDGEEYYTRLEYHRFDDNDRYLITNKTYVGASENDLSREIGIEASPWKDIEPEVSIEDLEHPLFAVLRMPGANPIDVNSPLGMPIFADAIEELMDLDVAYSRNAEEIFDSERTILMDTDKLINQKGVQNNVFMQKHMRETMELPKYVRNVSGDGASGFYQEINPTLNTPVRISGIDAILSQIGYKCGFSNGYFVFNQKSGMVTATQVESEDRRTLQLIKDIRDQLEKAMKDLVYAMNAIADLYDVAPGEDCEVICDFGDLTYNWEEDRARWIQYVNMGIVPKWKLLEKFEGMTEEEAKAMQEDTEQAETDKALQQQSLFGGME